MGLVQDALRYTSTGALHWDDIIHITPRPEISPQEKAEYKRRKKQGLPSNLTPEQEAELQRRKAVAQRISRSEAPKWRKKMNSILGMMDNIEDAITTAAYISRVAGMFFPPAMELSGVLMGIAGIMDLAMMIDPMRWNRSEIKKMFRDSNRRSPKGKRGKWGENARARQKPHTWSRLLPKKYREPYEKVAKYLPTLGEALEIGQTSDWLFGVGISLGPIFGTKEENLWSAGKKAWHEYRHTETAIGVSQGRLVAETSESPTRIVPVTHDMTSRKLLNSLPMMPAFMATMPDDDIVRGMTAGLIAIQSVAEAHQQYEPDEPYLELIDAKLSAPIPTRPLTLLALEELGCDPYAGIGWPTRGGDRESVLSMHEEIRQDGQAALNGVLEGMDPYHIRTAYIGTAANVTMLSGWELNLSPLDKMDWDDSSLGYVASKIPHYGIWPAEDAERKPWVDALGEMVAERDMMDTGITRERMLEILRNHGAKVRVM